VAEQVIPRSLMKDYKDKYIRITCIPFNLGLVRFFKIKTLMLTKAAFIGSEIQ